MSATSCLYVITERDGCLAKPFLFCGKVAEGQETDAEKQCHQQQVLQNLRGMENGFMALVLDAGEYVVQGEWDALCLHLAKVSVDVGCE